MHAELLQRAADPVLKAVIEAHCPDTTWITPDTHTDCAGCNGNIQGDGIGWPDDCSTTTIAARGLGVTLV